MKKIELIDDSERDLHKNHRERMRESFINNGADSFEEHTMLELLLFYAIPRVDTNETAHRLLNHFGSIAEVFEAPYEELIKVRGISKNSATLIKMMPAISKMYMKSRCKDIRVFDTPQKLGEFFVNKFIGVTEEQIYVMLLDKSMQLIKCENVSKGTVDMTGINIRVIVDLVVKHKASSVVLAHNHPRGLVSPSTDDLAATSKIKLALKQLEITFIDHIIVAQNDYLSLVDSGFVLNE